MDRYGLSDSQIAKYVGRTSFDRGKSYYKNGRVIDVTFDARRNVTASVRGIRRYKVAVQFGSRHGNRYIAGSTCSCPVGRNCKHIAAVLLKTREKLAEETPEAEVLTKPAWQTMLDSLTISSDSQSETGIVGVLFELQHTATTRGSYYGSPKITKPASRGALKLGLRPIVPGASGRWINNSLTWAHVGGWNRLGMSASHQKWFKEFWAMYQTASGDGQYYGEASRWVYLDDFASSHVWSLLKQGEDVGVPFIQANRNQTKLAMSDVPFETVVNITTARKGDLKIAPGLQYEGHKVTLENMRFFGDPATGVYLWREGNPQASPKEADLQLAPLDKPLEAGLKEQVMKKRSTVVPSSDVESFKQQHYPQLAQRLKIVADDRTQLPELGKPLLVVCVQPDSATRLRVALSWRYATHSQASDIPLRPTAKEHSSVMRSEREERRIVALFTSVTAGQPAFFDANEDLVSEATLAGMAAVGFATVQLPRLQALGTDMHVEIEGALPEYEEFTDEPLVQVATKESDGTTDWFDLSVSLKLGEQEVAMEQLLVGLGNNEPYLVLESGVFFRLDHPKLVQLKRMIDEARSLQDKESEGLTLSKFQAGLWEELAALGVVTEQADAWQKSLQGLLDIEFVPKVKVPATLQATLRSYQEQGFSWLVFLYTHHLGGILADDMGLGKTLQTIALVLHIRSQTPANERLPHLVVAPTSVAANWASELALFAPSLKVVHMQQTVGKAGVSLEKQIKKADVVISSYALCRFDEAHYLKQPWDAVIFDEAQFVKNHQSKGYQIARRLPARFKLALTGTPLENNLMELWSLLSIVAPGLFPSPKHFAEFYQKPIERQGSKELLAQLRQRVRPLMLRRTKDKVVKELPPKIEQTLELELNKDHRRVYDLYLQRERQRVLGLLGDFDKNRFAILKAITTLRQLSLDPKLIDAEKYKNVSSTKLDRLLEQLDEVVSEGHRALIFSQFTSFLTKIRQALDERGIPYLYLDGATKQRGELLKEFKTTDVPLFLISLKSGGFGLNLTEADYCFLIDPWWNPAVEQQAIDRAHRIGQTKPVMVYRLIAKGTIEEKVMALKARKATLFTSVLDDGELFSAAITASDIRSLFE